MSQHYRNHRVQRSKATKISSAVEDREDLVGGHCGGGLASGYLMLQEVGQVGDF